MVTHVPDHTHNFSMGSPNCKHTVVIEQRMLSPRIHVQILLALGISNQNCPWKLLAIPKSYGPQSRCSREGSRARGLEESHGFPCLQCGLRSPASPAADGKPRGHKGLSKGSSHLSHMPCLKHKRWAAFQTYNRCCRADHSCIYLDISSSKKPSFGWHYPDNCSAER